MPIDRGNAANRDSDRFKKVYYTALRHGLPAPHEASSTNGSMVSSIATPLPADVNFVKSIEKPQHDAEQPGQGECKSRGLPEQQTPIACLASRERRSISAGDELNSMSRERSMSSAIGDVQHAFSLHRQGRLAEAESAYAALLARQPKHFDALHLLGMPNSKPTDPPAAVRHRSSSSARRSGV